ALKDGLVVDEMGLVLEQFLLESGNTRLAVNRPEKKIVSRSSLFANCAFRIQLTPFELENRQLIIGHRLMPFVHPGIPVEQLHFFDAREQIIPLIRSTFTITQESSIFFNLLPPYGITQYIEDHAGQDLSLAILDLKQWLRTEKFEPEDQLLVSVRDYAKLEFYLEKLNQREINSLRLADRFYEKTLTEGIYHVADIIGKSFLPVDMHLFWAFAQMDPSVIEKAGTPFGPFISRHENLTFFQEGPYAFLQDKNFMDDLMESAIQYAKNPPAMEMGVATDLDGILQEMGSSFSRLLLKAFMVEQLLEWDEIREEVLYDEIFGENKYPFFNDRQEKNFKRAFSRLLKSVKDKWADRELALPHLQLLRKAIQFKMEIIHLLRELNTIEDPQQLNMQALLQLQPIDQSLDQIMDNLLSKKPMAYQEAQALVKQLDSGREKFLLFREDLLEE
ncbi:MAG: hypothetical protein KDD04_07245, partial [Sinomicrobium sp.]|nr:hypothetical protein [Sinomicrobium sp.]